MMTPSNRYALKLLAVFLFVALFSPISGFSQDDPAALKGKVDGLDERVSTLESTVGGMAKLKISGYVQPQWLWNDADSLANQVNAKNYFQIRRGRVKFVYTTGDVSATVYPDISENGVVLKEVYATWNAIKSGGSPMLGFSMGAMNRPFGYEIAYSSSAREVTERSKFEQTIFNGERDLGLQLNLTPIFGDIKPLIEVGIFNGTDNFGTGPSAVAPGGNDKAGFTFVPVGNFGTVAGVAPYAAPKGADSLFQTKVNSAVAKETALFLNTQGGLPGGTSGAPLGQPQKELIGHLRLPFLLSDEFSFDVGASIEMGGIVEPSNVIGKYTGTNGALVLANSGTQAGHSFTNQNHTFLGVNRNMIGVDAQAYLSVLPIGGTILKFELYSGQTPFYGSANLFSGTGGDFTNLGDPVASTIYKKVSGMYVMLVQNITDWLQLAARYETFDPNTEVTGTNFAVKDGAGNVVKLRGVAANSNLGGDLALNTLSVDLNFFISGAMRLMLDLDMPMSEDFTRADPLAPTNIQTVKDAHDNRFTLRMQVKF